MTNDKLAKLGSILVPAVTAAILIDVNAYKEALKTDPSAKFDLSLLGKRVLIAVVTALVTQVDKLSF